MLFAIGSFAQKMMSFVFVPFYTAVLSTSDYGISDLILTLCNMLWPFFTLLINDAVLRFCLDKKADKRQVVSIGIYINIVGTMLMLIVSPIVVHAADLQGYEWYFIAYYIAFMLNSFFSYALRGLELTKLFSVTGVINTGIAISCNLLFLVVFKLGLKGYLLSFIIAYTATSIVQFVLGNFRKFIINPFKINREFLLEMIKYSVPLVPNSISWWLSNSANKVILSQVCGVAANGLYSVAFKIPSIITVCSSIFSNAWQISAVDGFGSEENRRYFSDIYYKYSTVCMYLVSAIIVFNKLICKILFSNDFYYAWVFVPVLVYAVSYQIMSGFLGTIYTTAKKTKMVFISTVIAAVSNIVLSSVLIPRMEGMGAAISTCISYFIIWIIRVFDSRKIMVLDVDWRREVVCNILLLAQVVLGCQKSLMYSLACFIIFLLVLFLKRDFLTEFCGVFLRKLKIRR